VKANRTQAFDLALTIRWQAVRRPLLGRFMSVASWPGFPPQSRLIPAFVVGALLLLRLRVEAAFQVAAWLTAGIAEALKMLMKRSRPIAGTDLRVVVAPLGGSSFPSGHVITYVGTYGWLAYVVHANLRPLWLRRVLVTGLAALVVSVGPSRIYQGHHWPTDVAASYLLGFSYLSLLASMYRRIKTRQVADATAPSRP
jgi:undecaprenyl-diphosphatase